MPTPDTLLTPLRGQLARFGQLWAYVKVGVVNAGFGYAVFSLLVFLAINMFAAQIIAHLAGMVFNYFMFRRFVFKNSRAAVVEYIATYAVNYVLGLAILAGLSRLIPSPYISGFLAIAIVAAINFVVLKFLVFTPPKPT